MSFWFKKRKASRKLKASKKNIGLRKRRSWTWRLQLQTVSTKIVCKFTQAKNPVSIKLWKIYWVLMRSLNFLVSDREQQFASMGLAPWNWSLIKSNKSSVEPFLTFMKPLKKLKLGLSFISSLLSTEITMSITQSY